MQQNNQSTGRICPRGASYYMWKEGDTLTSVAMRNKTTAAAIEMLNPDLNFAAIPVGTEICMPSRALTCPSGQPYTIRNGDTFFGIARRLGITTAELLSRNPGISAEGLMPGQVICIPAQNGSSDVLDGTAQDNNTVTPDTPVLDGTAQDNNTVPPQPVRPVYACPTGYQAQRVQPGQSYADLLVDLNVSYRAMRSANPLLRPGAMVAGTPYCAPPAGTRETCTTGRRYTMEPGENLTSLARKLNTTKGRLLMLNPTLLPTDFSSGTVICIP